MARTVSCPKALLFRIVCASETSIRLTGGTTQNWGLEGHRVVNGGRSLLIHPVTCGRAGVSSAARRRARASGCAGARARGTWADALRGHSTRAIARRARSLRVLAGGARERTARAARVREGARVGAGGRHVWTRTLRAQRICERRSRARAPPAKAHSPSAALPFRPFVRREALSGCDVWAYAAGPGGRAHGGLRGGRRLGANGPRSGGGGGSLSWVVSKGRSGCR